MHESQINIPSITIVTKTIHGIVKSIIGSSGDHVIFINDQGKPKIITTRDDEVYKEALSKSISLSTEAGAKFQGVHQELIDQLLGLCMSAAMKEGVKLEDVKNAFEPAREFIKQKNQSRNY